jgi:hypothetical protein
MSTRTSPRKQKQKPIDQSSDNEHMDVSDTKQNVTASAAMTNGQQQDQDDHDVKTNSIRCV